MAGADEKLSTRAETADPTGGSLHIIKGLSSFRISFINLVSGLVSDIDTNTLYRPAIEPAVTANILTLDCQDRNACIFEPTPRPIVSNFAFAAFSNIVNTNIIQVTLSLTGVIVISFEANIKVSNPSNIGTWGASMLTLSAGINDLIELSFAKDRTTGDWLLAVGEANV